MTKLIEPPKKLTFPSGLYEYLVRKANSAVNERFIAISFPILEINFKENLRRGSKKTVDWLFEELSKRLVAITKKYKIAISQSSGRRDVMIDLVSQGKDRLIKLTGYHYIPVKSFGNMLSITVWSYIVYSTGTKPSENSEANRIYKKFVSDFEEFKNYWNRIPRKKVALKQDYSCYICGKPAVVFNHWIYKGKATSEEVYTPVCRTHNNRLI
ncbi:MAG: hypothetical protein ACTSSG_02010 [Candidatus Heimdallarchaeaceae archaeon]